MREHLQLAKAYADERQINNQEMRNAIEQAFISGYYEAKHTFKPSRLSRKKKPRDTPPPTDKVKYRPVAHAIVKTIYQGGPEGLPRFAILRARFEWDGGNSTEFQGPRSFVLEMLDRFHDLEDRMLKLLPESLDILHIRRALKNVPEDETIETKVDSTNEMVN